MPKFIVVMECTTYDRYSVEAESAQAAYDKVRAGKCTTSSEEVQSQTLEGVYDGDDYRVDVVEA